MNIPWLPSAIRRPAAYAIGLFASKGLALIMLPILANHLSVAEIGKLELYTSSGVFIGLLLSFALHEALYRFAGHEQQAQKQAKIASEILTAACGIALLALATMLLVLFFASEWLSAFPAIELVLLAIGVSLEGLISLLLAWLRMGDRVIEFVRVTLSVCFGQVLLVGLSLWLSLGVAGILGASVLAHALQLIWLHKLCRLTLRLPTNTRAREFFAYSVPIALSGLLAFALNGAERWVIAANGSIELLAHYAIAAKFALALCILVQPFGMWWMPKRFATLASQGVNKAARVTQYGVLWIMMLCAFMAYFAPMFISLTLPGAYSLAGQFVLLTLLAAVFKEITELVNLGLLAKKQTKQLLRFNLIASLFGALMMVMLWSFGVWGVISALISAQLLKLVLVYQSSQKLYRLPYSLKPMLIVGFCSMTHLWLSSTLTDWHAQLLMCGVAPLSVALTADLTGIISIPQLMRKKTQVERV